MGLQSVKFAKCGEDIRALLGIWCFPREMLAAHMTVLLTGSVCPFLSQDYQANSMSCCPIMPLWILSLLVLITLYLCLPERSNGGDCHLGAAHSNTTQGRYMLSCL